jgi:hypothetical protein
MHLKTTCFLCLSIALIPFTSTPALAQADADLERRIFNLGILRTGKSTNKSGKKRVDPKVILAQVQDDFSKLQVANNQLAEANEKLEELDLSFARTTLDEMQTRAERLMENLTEAKAHRNEVTQFPSNRKQLKDLIVSLDTVVGEFAHNRVFFEASPDDEKLAKKALKDLDQMIQIIARLLKGVQQLTK